MNVGTLKLFATLVSVGLFGGMAYLGYDFYTNDLKRMAGPADLDHTVALLQGVKAPEPPRQVGLDYQGTILPAVGEFDWTGTPPPPPKVEGEDEAPTAEAAVVIPVDQIVTVVGTLADSTDDGKSFALLVSAAASKGTGDNVFDLGNGCFYVGDTLPAPHDDVAIFAVRDDGVEFSFADEAREHEFLTPPTRFGSDFIYDVADAKSVRRAPGIRFAAQNRSEGLGPAGSNGARLTQKRNDQYYLGADDLSNFGQNYQDILANEVRLETYRDPKTGKNAGLKVAGVTAGSIAARHGAQEGDVIISINGQSVTSEQQAIQYVRNNSESTKVWRVRYLRLGEEREQVYHSPEE